MYMYTHTHTFTPVIKNPFFLKTKQNETFGDMKPRIQDFLGFSEREFNALKFYVWSAYKGRILLVDGNLF